MRFSLFDCTHASTTGRNIRVGRDVPGRMWFDGRGPSLMAVSSFRSSSASADSRVTRIDNSHLRLSKQQGTNSLSCLPLVPKRVVFCVTKLPGMEQSCKERPISFVTATFHPHDLGAFATYLARCSCLQLPVLVPGSTGVKKKNCEEFLCDTFFPDHHNCNYERT